MSERKLMSDMPEYSEEQFRFERNLLLLKEEMAAARVEREKLQGEFKEKYARLMEIELLLSRL